MRKISKNLGLLLIIIIIGAVLGGLMGEIIGIVVPEGKFRQFFLKGPTLSLTPNVWNLVVLSITFGVSIKINVCAVLGIVSSVFLFRKL